MSDGRENKARTVGVSLLPDLRERASDRARALGLSFSRYVALCLEAELRGEVPRLVSDPEEPPGGSEAVNMDEALQRGRRYAAMKALSIDFENDIEALLRAEGLAAERGGSCGDLRSDFLVQLPRGGNETPWQVAVECRANIRHRYTVTLGHLILLQSQPQVDGVVLVVPYTRGFDTPTAAALRAHGVPLVTPDSLPGELQELARKLEGTGG